MHQARELGTCLIVRAQRPVGGQSVRRKPVHGQSPAHVVAARLLARFQSFEDFHVLECEHRVHERFGKLASQQVGEVGRYPAFPVQLPLPLLSLRIEGQQPAHGVIDECPAQESRERPILAEHAEMIVHAVEVGEGHDGHVAAAGVDQLMVHDDAPVAVVRLIGLVHQSRPRLDALRPVAGGQARDAGDRSRRQVRNDPLGDHAVVRVGDAPEGALESRRRQPARGGLSLEVIQVLVPLLDVLQVAAARASPALRQHRFAEARAVHVNDLAGVAVNHAVLVPFGDTLAADVLLPVGEDPREPVAVLRQDVQPGVGLLPEPRLLDAEVRVPPPDPRGGVAAEIFRAVGSLGRAPGVARTAPHHRLQAAGVHAVPDGLRHHERLLRHPRRLGAVAGRVVEHHMVGPVLDAPGNEAEQLHWIAGPVLPAPG